jgi:hypothetical protein
MSNCHEMKKGQIYACKGCGLELEVVKKCKECGISTEECECEPCTFVCCGEELKLKE